MNAPWDRRVIEFCADGYVDTVLGGRAWPRLWWMAWRVRKAPWVGY